VVSFRAAANYPSRVKSHPDKLTKELGAALEGSPASEGLARRILATVSVRPKPFEAGPTDETPSWCIDAILPHLRLKREPIIVDAGCGSGAIAARLSAQYPKAEIFGFDTDPDRITEAWGRGLVNASFHLTNFDGPLDLLAPPDLVVMHPPRALATRFVTRASQLVHRRTQSSGALAALIPISWLAGRSKREFLERRPPTSTSWAIRITHGSSGRGRRHRAGGFASSVERARRSDWT
jgi:hypothetical protein